MKDFQELIEIELEEIKGVLLVKNGEYGNSALDPVRVFSKADPIEQLKVRIDDKLSRLAKGKGSTEDTVLDLMGYLVLLRIAQKLKRQKEMSEIEGALEETTEDYIRVP